MSDVYILDEMLRRNFAISEYNSFIWTERYTDHGDFVLDIHLRDINEVLTYRDIIVTNVFIEVGFSDELMLIETVETFYDSEGRFMLKAKGRTFDVVALSARSTVSGYARSESPVIENEWTLEPHYYMQHLIRRAVDKDQGLVPEDRIANVDVDFTNPATGGLPYDPVKYKFPEPKSDVWSAVKDAGQTFDIGLKAVHERDQNLITFRLYKGQLRTKDQDYLSTVIFSTKHGNIDTNTTIQSSMDHRNVAYVFSQHGSAWTTRAATVPSGFYRRVLHVDASDINLEASPELQTALVNRGRMELAKHAFYNAIDATITDVSPFIYGRDYYLGDIVNLQNDFGEISEVLVTEQIFVSDSNGTRSYPTLTSTGY